MVKKLVELNEQYRTVIATIGDGHVPGMSKLLKAKDVEIETIRLSELREQKDTDSSSGQFSVNYKPI